MLFMVVFNMCSLCLRRRSRKKDYDPTPTPYSTTYVKKKTEPDSATIEKSIGNVDTYFKCLLSLFYQL